MVATPRGVPVAIDASDAAASDTGGAEADEEQEENPQERLERSARCAAFAERKKKTRGRRELCRRRRASITGK